MGFLLLDFLICWLLVEFVLEHLVVFQLELFGSLGLEETCILPNLLASFQHSIL